MKYLIIITTALMVFLFPTSIGNVQAAVADNTIPALVSLTAIKPL